MGVICLQIETVGEVQCKERLTGVLRESCLNWDDQTAADLHLVFVPLDEFYGFVSTAAKAFFLNDECDSIENEETDQSYA